MRKHFRQQTLGDVFEECKELFDNDKPRFLQLLESAVDIGTFIPEAFYNAFYKRYGRNRLYPLEGFIAALLLQKILSIPSDTLLIVFLKFSKELREFCGFNKVPDGSKFTRFKQDFGEHIELMFEQLVDYTEPICREIDAALAEILIYDTSGIEAYVKENNPKFINARIKQLKTYAKSMGFDESYDPYKAAYGSMPSCSVADDSVKQMHINGHFCYAHKFGIVANGLGIVRHIAFFDDAFKNKHPELIIEKKSDSPDEDKTIGDSSSLQPVLNDFYSRHSAFRSKYRFTTFLGDSSFDKGDHYTFLKDTCKFKKILIPINQRNSSSLPPVGYNEYGYPVCPNDKNLAMRRNGSARGKGRTPRIKWNCPNTRMKSGEYVCSCHNPCSTAKCGRTTYTFDNFDFRMLPGIVRDSDEWNSLYKHRCAVERSINHFKSNMCVADRKSHNSYTSKADLFLAGIAQLFTVVVAKSINKSIYFRSLKPLVA